MNSFALLCKDTKNPQFITIFALKISKSLVIDEECVVMPNDFLYLGLLPLYERYATGLTEASKVISEQKTLCPCKVP